VDDARKPGILYMEGSPFYEAMDHPVERVKIIRRKKDSQGHWPQCILCRKMEHEYLEVVVRDKNGEFFRRYGRCVACIGEELMRVGLIW